MLLAKKMSVLAYEDFNRMLGVVLIDLVHEEAHEKLRTQRYLSEPVYLRFVMVMVVGCGHGVVPLLKNFLRGTSGIVVVSVKLEAKTAELEPNCQEVLRVVERTVLVAVVDVETVSYLSVKVLEREVVMDFTNVAILDHGNHAVEESTVTNVFEITGN